MFGKYQEPIEIFQEIHIDIIGPLTKSNGNVYCLTCIDRLTNLVEVIPVDTISVETIARVFYNNWITRFETVCIIVTIRRTQFSSDVFKNISRIYGIKLNHTQITINNAMIN